MTCRVMDFDEERLKKCLAQIYEIQVRNGMPDDIMPVAMEKLGLDDRGAIDLLSSFISRGWLNTGNIKEKFFLRPGYICSFPVIISSAGLEKIK
ncbi:MAG: hypothetical protein M1543_03775 [Firmicutes bacterium]|nr:hypothetical protein [Bacillota bacterium]